MYPELRPLMHNWCVLPTSIKHVSKQENVSVVLITIQKRNKNHKWTDFCCPTNNSTED